jgi:hypothetical protein
VKDIIRECLDGRFPVYTEEEACQPSSSSATP